MPQIINPYKSGPTMGEDMFGIGGLADTFFGPKASTAAYTREKFKEAQRHNEYAPLIADALAKTAKEGGDISQLLGRGIMGGESGQNIANYYRLGTAVRNQDDLSGNATTAALVGAGGPYGSTPRGVGEHNALTQATEYGKLDRLTEADRLKTARTPVTVFDPASPTGTKTVFMADIQANPGKYDVVPSQDIFKSAAAARYLFPPGGAAPASPFDTGAAPVPFTSGGAPSPSVSPLAALSSVPAAAPSAAPISAVPPRPVLNANQLAFLGAEPKPDRGQNFYVTNASGEVVDQGVTEDNGRTRIGGQPVALNPGERINIASPLNPTSVSALGTAPGKSELKDFRTAVNHANQTLALGQKIIDTVNKNPTVVGPVGNLKRMGQEGADLLNSLNLQFGAGRAGDYEATVAQTRNKLINQFGAGAKALLPELFDPDLNSIQTMNGMLLYKAAAALGQSGRDASDKDILQVKKIVGEPDSWFTGPNTYKNKVTQLLTIVQQQRDSDNAMIQPGARVAPNAVNIPAPVPGAPMGTSGAAIPPPPPGFIPN